VTSNVLVARFYERWDWTSSGIYTLSQATRETLHGLREPIDIVVFLGRSDPLTVSVRHMLTAYGAETTKLQARFVDPDRDPAQFMALQQKYGILAGKTEDGRIVTDASIVIARGAKHWFVTTDDMMVYDEGDGRVRPRLEQALTEGIRNVLERDKSKICFTTGHQEISIEDSGPSGLAELRFRLEKNNYEVQVVDLSAPAGVRLDDCHVVVVAGPEVAFEERRTRQLSDYLRGGGNLILAVNPVLNEENRIVASGLEPVAREAGIELGSNFIVERDSSLRLPTGLGETFFVTPKRHDITKGLVRADERVEFKVLVSAAQSMKGTPKGSATELLTTSAKAFGLRDVRPFVEQGLAPEKRAGDAAGPFAVAMAAELAQPSRSDRRHGPRLVAVGSANVVWARGWREPTLLGNRLFIESALSWLAARPAIVSVPEKASHALGLSLTEESLGEVWRYVILYMPGAAALLGGFILMRRRAVERRSRRERPRPADGDKAP
jgi:hypothetical protein